VPAGQVAKLSDKDVLSQVESIRGRQSAAIGPTRSAMKLDESISSSWTANTAANDYQCIELAVGKDVLRSGRAVARCEGRA